MLKNFTGAGKLLGVEKRIILGRPEFTIRFEVVADGEPVECNVPLKPGVWNRSAVISALIRSFYSQDEMEAISNNRLSVFNDMMNAIRTDGVSGAVKVMADMSETDNEYETMQKWRKIAKKWATELIHQYPEIDSCIKIY